MISNLQYIFEFIIKKPPNESNEQEKNIDDQKEEHFLALDSDGDKRITREELIQYLHKLEGMKDEKKRNKRDPDQILKEREELIEDIFKSKGSLKYSQHIVHIVWKFRFYDELTVIFLLIM